MRTKTGNLLGSPWKFQKHGQCGTEVSELLPHIGSCVDDICVIRSMVADNINHNGACLQMNTGEQTFSRPSLGSWLLYGLGSENQNLPGFVVHQPRPAGPGRAALEQQLSARGVSGNAGRRSEESDRQSGQRAASISAQQRDQLDALQRAQRTAPRAARGRQPAQRAHRIVRAGLSHADAKRRRHSTSSGESPETQKLYGVGDPVTEIFGKQCLMARRLAERGVRMVQVYHTQTVKRASCQLWDQHGDLRAELTNNCAATDQPIAGCSRTSKRAGCWKTRW